MPNTWVLVANGSEARIYATEIHPKTLTLVQEFSHPEGREKGNELASDRPGHYQGDAPGMEGTTHGSFNEPISPKEYEIERFAMRLAKELDSARTSNSFERLVIVSSPNFHGLVNKHLNGHVSKMVVQHINKDYTSLKEPELIEKLRSA